MKQKDISVSDIAAALEISKTKTQVMLNTATIDILTLVRVSEILSSNFFSYYESGKVCSKIELQEKKANRRSCPVEGIARRKEQSPGTSGKVK